MCTLSLGVESGNDTSVQEPVEAGAGDEADVVTAAGVVEPCRGHLVEERAEPLRVEQESLGGNKPTLTMAVNLRDLCVAPEATRTNGHGELRGRRKPKKSRWSTMNVDPTAVSQPRA